MASSTADALDQVDYKPSKQFLAELFRGRYLADTTITIGKGHVFKVHGKILKERSKWFAKELTHRKKLKIDFPSSVKQWNVLEWDMNCSSAHAFIDPTCNGKYSRVSQLFQEFLRYCYTGEYQDNTESRFMISPDPEEQKLDRCRIHVSMYQLAEHFGVESLIQHSSQRYQDTALTIKSSNLKFLRSAFQLVFKDESMPNGDSSIYRAATHLCLEHSVRVVRKRAGADGLNLLRKRLREICTRCGEDCGEEADKCSDCVRASKRSKTNHGAAPI